MKRDLVSKISFSKSMNTVATDSEGALGGVLILYNSRAFKLTPILSVENVLLVRYPTSIVMTLGISLIYMPLILKEKGKPTGKKI